MTRDHESANSRLSRSRSFGRSSGCYTGKASPFLWSPGSKRGAAGEEKSMGESTTMDPARADDRRRALIARMAGAAADWLASLSPDQRGKARFDFPADDERTRWYYTPTE